jgi:predicted glycosyltransferase
MLRNRIYYNIKPFIPHPWRKAIRRQLALRQRNGVDKVWPIMPGSERPPAGWRGWPAGKKFAFVLTHDVESEAGLNQCQELMHREMVLGFKSCFNFIPEGTYRTPRKLREELVRNGFEVGVHDLRHNGRLYRSKSEFQAKAERINTYLRDWGAVGFRSGFMLHNLDWLHALEISYDASTFDTDPFEPQPEGRHTIFPFWIPAPPSDETLTSNSDLQFAVSDSPSPDSAGRGYVELPYTLPQDSTLFLLLGEQTIDLWKRKVDWLAAHGGMILLDTHPDYMSMGTNGSMSHRYPVAFYTELLEYIRTTYADQYWAALPREVASWVGAGNGWKDAPPQRSRGGSNHKPKIWIDLDNTPHVPFFEPIVDELHARKYPVLLTARDAFQVCDLADKKGLKYAKIGRHHGRNPALKAAGLLYRSMQLAPVILREKPLLAVSHGARSQILLSNWLGISTVLIEDYEYCKFPIMMRPSWVMAPNVIPDGMLPLTAGQIRKYDGIKEDVYAWKLSPDKDLLRELGLSESDLVVTVRPPATEAHYHNPESEQLFDQFMIRACGTPGVRVVLLPRNHKQAATIKSHWPAWFEEGKTVIPSRALDGLNLLWHSDLVVSGGGTMNREAAALGIPVYSIFRGSIGAVDRDLSAHGRLVLIESVQDVHEKIQLAKRPRRELAEVTSRRALSEIVDSIEEIAEFNRRRISPRRTL